MCVRDSIQRGMQLVRTGSQRKYYGLSSLMKNASFSRGWLHLAVQCFFAVLIVVSFILIVMMSIPKYSKTRPVPERKNRCHAKNCIVHCEDVPYFGRYEEDIVYTVSNIPDTCSEFHLALRNPMFVNGTVSTALLPRLPIPIHELTINGGNLKHFPPDAFLNQNAANIRTLALFGLVIKTWTTGSLVGLSNLAEIYLKGCTLGYVQAHVLRPVHDTLTMLTITKSKGWDPVNVTGVTTLRHLGTVDFSYNVFHDVLSRNSFTGLENCKILYLNSCKIIAIGIGTFDHLRSIEMLFLNNNLLVTLPVGLFNNILSIVAPKPRLNLQDNLWHCDCTATEIRQLVREDMLLTDPVCKSPKAYRGKTFFEFESYCKNDIEAVQITPPPISVPAFEAIDNISGFVYTNNGCYDGQENSSNALFRIMSPVYDRQCVSRDIYKENISTISATRSSGQIVSQYSWIKFTFVLKTATFSMVQITASEANEYGMLWYQSTCPNEVYCVSAIPHALRVYNVDMTAQYIFCPILLITGSIEQDKCVFYNLATMDHADFESKLQILFYICTGGICLIVGAICVYALVRKHPYLLKGSKRILFVKHKTVDALVLPPKVPVRKELEDDIAPDFNDKNIFIVSAHTLGSKFNRNISTRSSKSNAPSYISALQPTEEQLAEWRGQNNFTNDLTSDFATYSWICSADSFHYIDVIDNERTYESLK